MSGRLVAESVLRCSNAAIGHRPGDKLVRQRVPCPVVAVAFEEAEADGAGGIGHAPKARGIGAEMRGGVFQRRGNQD